MFTKGKILKRYSIEKITFILSSSSIWIPPGPTECVVLARVNHRLAPPEIFFDISSAYVQKPSLKKKFPTEQSSIKCSRNIIQTQLLVIFRPTIFNWRNCFSRFNFSLDSSFIDRHSVSRAAFRQ
jgi:hypothetical protein